MSTGHDAVCLQSAVCGRCQESLISFSVYF